MTKLRNVSPTETEKHHEALQEFFKHLIKQDVENNKSGFSTDKKLIQTVFEMTEEATRENIRARLTLIDSMYSTQMNRRYYALDDLADFLFKLSEGKQGLLKEKFIAFSKNPDANQNCFSIFGHNEQGELEGKNLFAQSYGIGKDGKEKGVAISLISKYAYFDTGFRFPIYDSIACEMYPLVWHYCGFKKEEKPKIAHSDKSGKILGKETMVEYVKAINLLIDKIAVQGLNYDMLDRFLWFVGKILRGNLSLVLTKEQYQETLNLCPVQETAIKHGKKGKKDEQRIFDIADFDINKLTFLKEQKILRSFFEFAQYYKKI